MPPNRRPPRNRRLQIETSGIPRGPDTSPELARKFALHFGLIPKPEREPLPLPEVFTDVVLGNEDLPVYEYLDQIVEAVDTNPVTICVGETGSGKSTQIAQRFLQRGYKVVLTQPRRLAAEMLAKRISDEISAPDKLGSGARMLVGFQTAEKNTITDDTRLSVVTDGLRLVQELGVFDRDKQDDQPEVLIIDEVHERNVNIDVLIAWTQKRISEGANLRVVFTTASINAEKLARHYDKVGAYPPIIEVPGRTHEIERLERPESTVAEEAARYARQGKSVLTFLPGLSEIEDAISATQRMLGPDKGKYTFLRLHGKMSPQEQALIEMEHEGNILVFATNAAETSITIPDVDVVVDSGLVRLKQINEEGIERLPAVPSSMASCIQRSGRCGRTKPGTYVLTRLDNRVTYVPLIQRPEYTTPEILRSNVDKTVLSVAGTGLDISELDMLDKLDETVVLRSKRALRILGALDEQYKITDRGRRMNQFPVRPSLSRMMVYGLENNFSEETRSYIAAIAAAVESGGLPDYSRDSQNQWKKLVSDKSSDLMAQLDIFIASQEMSAYEMSDNDLNIRSLNRARELYVKLLRRSKIRPGLLLIPPTAVQKEQIREAIVAGMIDFVYEKSGSEYKRTSYKMGKIATLRAIGDRSVVNKRSASLVVASPYVIAPPPGRETLPEKHIIQDVTTVTPEILAKVAFDLCEWQADDGGFVWRDGIPFTIERQTFRGTVRTGLIKETRAEWSVGLAHEIIGMLRRKPGRHLRKILSAKKESEQLWHRSGTVVPIHENQITETLEIVSGIRKKSMPSKPMNTGMLDNALEDQVERFEAMLPSFDERRRIMESSPDYIDYQGIALSLGYQKGVPYVSRITDDMKEDLRSTEGPLQLPDGRDILVSHTVNTRNRRLKIEDFRQQHS